MNSIDKLIASPLNAVILYFNSLRGPIRGTFILIANFILERKPVIQKKCPKNTNSIATAADNR